MQWLLTLDSDRDPIVLCRLMNNFRRKGVEIETMTLAAKAELYSCIAVVNTAQTDVDHLFHYIRRTEGVVNVSFYRHDPSQRASFVFVESNANPESINRILAVFPEGKIIFASQGKYLLEIPSESRLPARIPGMDELGFLPLSRVRTSQQNSHSQLVGAA